MENNNISQLVEDFKKGGWLIAILGGMGMLARLILTNQKYGFFEWFRKIIAGAIVGVICYFALYGLEINLIYKSMFYSMSGAIAPELFEILRKKILRKIIKL
jgi:hypothetical protein